MQIQGTGSRLTMTPHAATTAGPPTAPGTSTHTSPARRDSATIADTFTPTATDPDARADLLRRLTRLRDEILGQDVAPSDDEKALKSLQELTDDEFDRGLAAYDKHRDKTRAFDPYLTDTDRGMVGLLYDKYEKKYGEGTSQLDKVTRFAGQLATLRMTGALVQTDEQKEAEAARNERRADRAEAEQRQEAARAKAHEEREKHLADLDTRIGALQAPDAVTDPTDA